MLTYAFARRLVYVVLVAITFLIPLHNASLARASPILIIGEVAWAGSSASLADEWLEIWNLSDQPVELNGLSLVGASDKPIFLPPDAIIAPQSVYLIANYSESDPKSLLEVAPQMVTSSLSLSNSALLIRLLDTEGNEIDRAGTGGAPPAGSSTDKLSMIRQSDAWISATSSPGTSGFCDGCLILSNNPLYDTPFASSALDELPAPEEATAASSSTLALEAVLDTASTASSTDYAQDIQTIITDTSTATSPVAEVTATSTEELFNYEAMPQISPTSTSVSTSTIMITPTSTSVKTTAEETIEPRYDLIRINEVMSQPESGLEWIELISLDDKLTIPLQGLSLYDAVGKLADLEGTLSTTTTFILISLSSARLNNGGDTIFLRDEKGALIDSFIYEESQKSLSWARLPDGFGAWQLTALPTPSEPNSLAPLPGPFGDSGTIQEPPAKVGEALESGGRGQNEINVPALRNQKSQPEQKVSYISPTPTTVTKPAVNTAKSEVSTPEPKKRTAPKTNAGSTKPKVSVKKPTKKSSAPKRPPPKLLPDYDMATLETYRGLHVRLRGTVSSPGGLLTNHGFILLAPDGKGLMVRAPKKIKLPPLGSQVEISGLLEFSSQDIPSLKINAATDIAQTSLNVEEPKPRMVDLLAPDDEDLWSLVSVTGTVLSVKGTRVLLATDETEVDIVIRPVIKYRTERIKNGDTLTVIGLLNSSKEAPAILPRQANDVQIVAHAPPPKSQDMARAWPDWMPFGAAGIAVAANEGAKYLRERHKRRKLEQKLQTA